MPVMISMMIINMLFFLQGHHRLAYLPNNFLIFDRYTSKKRFDLKSKVQWQQLQKFDFETVTPCVIFVFWCHFISRIKCADSQHS